MNWPVARSIADYLQSIAEHLTEDIINILDGDDDVWKCWCVSVFGLNATKPIDPKLMTEFRRIALNPTQGEVEEEVQELALEFVEIQ